jgi:hypothetical protein
MSAETERRKLAAIMFAGVIGYSVLGHVCLPR